MADRNALLLIKKALEEKLVSIFLPPEKGEKKLYLIKISGDGIDSFKDFCRIYSDKVDTKPFNAAKDRLQHVRTPGALKNHGVLIDPETLDIVFTFNMAFADYHRGARKLIRFPLNNIFPVMVPEYQGRPCMNGEPCFGERANQLVNSIGYFPIKNVGNCLASFEGALSKHMVNVRLLGEADSRQLYLIKIWAKTNLREDFKFSYPGEDIKRLNSVMGMNDALGDAFHEYGLFIKPGTLKILFAFNTAFADYDRQQQIIVYKPIFSFEPDKKPERMHTPHWNPSSSMNGVIMYALSEPRR